MRRLLLAAGLALACLQPHAAHAAHVVEWLEPPPVSLITAGQWVAIPDTSFFEIPESRLDTAKARLAERPVLKQENASYFGRPDFVCPKPSELYLVRALYISGGTRTYQLAWVATALIVSQGTLGPGNPPRPSALLACLARQPTAVYAQLSTAA